MFNTSQIPKLFNFTREKRVNCNIFSKKKVENGGWFTHIFWPICQFLCNNLLKYTLTPLIIHTYTLHRKYTLSFYQVTPSSFQCVSISANLYDRIGSDNSKRREITHPLVCWVFQLRGKFVRWDVVLLQLGSDLEIGTLLFVFDLHLQGLIR